MPLVDGRFPWEHHLAVSLTKESFLENLRNDLQIKYLNATQNFEPLFDLEAFKLCTDSIFPCLIFWGQNYKCFYNEVFAQLLNLNESTFFGKEGSSVFCKEAWGSLKPMLEKVIETKSTLGAEGELIYLDRKGFLEECYFDYNLEPIVVNDVLQGVYCIMIESTKRILDQRRLNILTQLSNETLRAHSIVNACEIITNILSQFKEDIPFTLTYLLRDHDKKDPLCSFGLDEGYKTVLGKQNPCDEIKYIDGLKNPVSKAVLIPIKAIGTDQPFCMIIFGISPTLDLNDDYKEFHLLLARFLSTILSKIQMIESKQKDLIARDEFISIASHEFKTPITALKLRLALTKRKICADPPSSTHTEMMKCIKISDQQADRLLSLVDELLDMTRIQRGKFHFHFEEMPLKTLITEVLMRFEDELHRSKNTFELKMEQELIVIWHKSRIDQVLVNLLTNSIKHAPASKITLSVAQDQGQIKMIYSDTGPGIAVDKHQMIFERFEGNQGPQRVEGLGLGLYIVREIVRGHGGTIQVQSEEGKGCSFLISIPVNP